MGIVAVIDVAITGVAIVGVAIIGVAIIGVAARVNVWIRLVARTLLEKLGAVDLGTGCTKELEMEGLTVRGRTTCGPRLRPLRGGARCCCSAQQGAA